MRHGNVSRATNESNFDDSKPFVTANGETIEEKSLNLAAMHKRLKLALKKQVGANTGVENAKHELNVAKTDVELRTEMLNAKVVLERVAEDQLETARASLFAATREAALKKKRITEDLEEKISMRQLESLATALMSQMPPTHRLITPLKKDWTPTPTFKDSRMSSMSKLSKLQGKRLRMSMLRAQEFAFLQPTEFMPRR